VKSLKIAVKFFIPVPYNFMNDYSTSKTSATLLGRLRQDPNDQAVWSEFVGRYGPKIIEWCRRWNLPDADSQDVTQEVLVILARKMSTFAYDPARSFRGWLKTVTRHAWGHYLESRERPGRGTGGDQAIATLESVEAGDDLVQRLNEEFDRELLEEAIVRVRIRVAPHTWEAFRLTALENQSGAEAAEALGMQVMTVFKAKSKVQKMLQEELLALDGFEGSSEREEAS
jgi:RNA polymerase sigma-70 factor (ECF subfamily)